MINSGYFLFRRFLARSIDYALIMLPMMLFLAERVDSVDIILMMSGVISIPIESLLIARFGTTLGKAVVNLKVDFLSVEHRYKKSFLRSIQAWLFGNACLIPYLSFVVPIFWFVRLNSDAQLMAYWDRKNDVVFRKLRP